MRFTFCPDCGTKLTLHDIGDEGPTPYCEKCKRPWFDMFSSCAITVVANQKHQVALLTQPYISPIYKNVVSGYIKPGETAEETAIREVKEELGLNLTSLQFVATRWFRQKGLLMIAFIGQTDESEFTLSKEVDAAEWVDARDALAMVHPEEPGRCSWFLIDSYLKQCGK